ncbi:MAG: type IV pilin protein [Myxococcota bacterium]
MRRNRNGFSLIEMMIVLAIITVLTAIVMPNFRSLQNRAKRSEVPSNVDGIKMAELAYDAAFDTYLSLAPAPDSTPGKQFRNWNHPTDFVQLGWMPDGQVRGSYSVDAVSGDYTVHGASDVDEDGVQANYTATSSVNATLAAGDEQAY